MKIAVLSDIHGNRAALEAVLEDVAAWQPDRLIVNGDLVNRGPYSLECVKMLQRAFPDVYLLRGNHEDFVLSCAVAHDPEHHAYDLRRFAHWTYDQLGAMNDEMAQWAESLDLDDLEGGSVHITHASVHSNRDGIHPYTSEAELAGKIPEQRDLFITSHTHKPLIRRFNATLVVNTGSVGAPFDGIAKAAYARLRFSAGRWHEEIRRVPFDRVRAERDFSTSGLLDEGGPLTQLMLRELRESRVIIGYWMREYYEAVKAGQISVEQSIREFLKTF